MNRKYIIYIGIVLLLLNNTACKKELDTNQSNPNGVTSAGISGKDVFANALQTTSTNITNSYAFANEWMGAWARTTAYSQSGQEPIENFALVNTMGNGIWQSEYHNIYDYNFVIKHSAANSILPGASQIMKAMVFQDVVDVFGNAPYTEGANPDTSTQPKYDADVDIYKGIISDIDAGIATVKASQSSDDDAADIMFKGDKTKWVKFANTLKLRILMRQVPNGDQSYVKTAIAAIVSEGSGFLGSDEDAVINPGYANVVGQQSPFWNGYGFEVNGGAKNNYTFYIANKTMIDFLNSTGDPRQGYLYDTTEGKNSGNYLGAVATANPVATLATMGSGVLQSASQSAVIMLATQSFFLQAEAAQRGLISGDYSALLKTAIEESFKFLKVPDAVNAADKFYTGSSDDRVNPKSSANPIKAIIYQKWVALCEIDGLETWSEFRRTGYPDRTNPSVSSGVSAENNVLPKRLLYPQDEYNLNSKNVNAENQTADGFKVKIFWGQ
jgi:hypothetical protein